MAKKVPALAPYDVPRLVCTECGEILRAQITVQANHKLTGIKAFCDNCEYCFEMSTPHGIGQIIAGGYQPPKKDAVRGREIIEIVGMSKAPAPQASNADDPRIQPPGGAKA